MIYSVYVPHPEHVDTHNLTWWDFLKFDFPRSINSFGCFMWRSWNIAASDNHLWQLQYASVFGDSENCLNIKEHQSGRLVEDEEYRHLQEAMTTRTSIDWRGAFIRAYIGILIQCPSIDWLDLFCHTSYYDICWKKNQYEYDICWKQNQYE